MLAILVGTPRSNTHRKQEEFAGKASNLIVLADLLHGAMPKSLGNQKNR